MQHTITLEGTIIIIGEISNIDISQIKQILDEDQKSNKIIFTDFDFFQNQPLTQELIKLLNNSPKINKVSWNLWKINESNEINKSFQNFIQEITNISKLSITIYSKNYNYIKLYLNELINHCKESFLQNFNLERLDFCSKDFYTSVKTTIQDFGSIIQKKSDLVNFISERNINSSFSKLDIKFIKQFETLSIEGQKSLKTKLNKLSSIKQFHTFEECKTNSFLYYAGICKSGLISSKNNLSGNIINNVSLTLDVQKLILEYLKLADISNISSQALNNYECHLSGDMGLTNLDEG